MGPNWRRSSFSGGGGNDNCVEVALTSAVAAVRDSKNPSPVLRVPASAWEALLRELT